MEVMEGINNIHFNYNKMNTSQESLAEVTITSNNSVLKQIEEEFMVLMVH